MARKDSNTFSVVAILLVIGLLGYGFFFAEHGIDNLPNSTFGAPTEEEYELHLKKQELKKAQKLSLETQPVAHD